MANGNGRFKLAPITTASSWNNLFWSQWEAAKRARGAIEASDGTTTPRLTNREVIALVSAFRALAPTLHGGWPLWYQFAAAAYGWNPTTDKFDTSQVHAARLYPIEATKELWLQLQRLAAELDEQRGSSLQARIELDEGDFSDVLMQGDTRKALIDDGASATSVNDVLCRDKKTGKLRFPKPKCDADGKGPKWFNPATGKMEHLDCDKPGDCDPAEKSNPIFRAIERNIIPIAIVVGAVFVAHRGGLKRRRLLRTPRRRVRYGTRTRS